MKNYKNKKSTAIAFILLLSAAALMTTIPVYAQTKTKLYAFCSVNPKIVGIGDSVLVNAWTTPPPLQIPGAVASSGYAIGIPRVGYTFTFLDPDGINRTMIGPDSYGDGTEWFYYTPDKVGNWSVTMYYAGDANFTAAETPEPFYFQVAEEPVYFPIPEIPLPTGYWTRPINAEARQWYHISGDWLQSNCNSNSEKWNEYCVGPASSHILWIWQSDWVGGLFGGENLDLSISSASERAGLSVGRVMNGRAFVTRPDGTHCLDVHTGEELWVPAKSMPLGYFAYTPTIDYLQNMPAYTGGEKPYENIYNFVSTGGMVQVWDPWKGLIYKNITGPGAGISSYDDVHGYFYRSTGGFLVKWDPCKNLGMGGLGTSLGTNFTDLIVWNVSGVPAPTRFYGEVGLAVSGGELWRINLNDGSATHSPTSAISSAVLDPTTGVLFGGNGSGGLTFNFTAWDTFGKTLWFSEPSDYPWGWFWSYGGWSASPGLFYHAGYAGYVYAWNATTGKIQWKFSSGDAGVNYPSNSWAFWGGIASAGEEGAVRVYAQGGEHTPTNPAQRGFNLFGIDANNGQELWHIAFTTASAPVIADGVLMETNGYDGRLYGFSKGPSATTVTAPDTAVPQGTAVLIRGTVMDMSPAQPNTPAVSDASVGDWMEYLHMDRPIPTNTTGVPVRLIAVDSNGTAITIGTTTSDMSGNFAYAWTPPSEDTYKITATFEGTESYGSSWAETAVSVGPAPTPFPEQATPADYTMTIVGLGIAIIIAVIIAVSIAVLILRKR